MIHAYGAPHEPVPRLVRALAARGHALARAEGAPPAAESTLVLGPGLTPDPMAIGVLLGAWRRTPKARVLVIGQLGTHPDARSPRLRDLWDIEELARASGLPTLVLRLGPLVGPTSPLWLKLRGRPRLNGADAVLLQPLVEDDAVESLDRALRGTVAWRDWCEVAGPDVLSLGELAALAEGAGPRLPADLGRWEPPLEELREQRLAEADTWIAQFGLTPSRVGEQAAAWHA